MILLRFRKNGMSGITFAAGPFKVAGQMSSVKCAEFELANVKIDKKNNVSIKNCSGKTWTEK